MSPGMYGDEPLAAYAALYADELSSHWRLPVERREELAWAHGVYTGLGYQDRIAECERQMAEM